MHNQWTDEIEKLRKQRDELLVAARMYIAAGVGNSTDYYGQVKARDYALRAIASIEQPK